MKHNRSIQDTIDSLIKKTLQARENHIIDPAHMNEGKYLHTIKTLLPSKHSWQVLHTSSVSPVFINSCGAITGSGNELPKAAAAAAVSIISATMLGAGGGGM